MREGARSLLASKVRKTTKQKCVPSATGARVLLFCLQFLEGIDVSHLQFQSQRYISKIEWERWIIIFQNVRYHLMFVGLPHSQLGLNINLNNIHTLPHVLSIIYSSLKRIGWELMKVFFFWVHCCETLKNGFESTKYSSQKMKLYERTLPYWSYSKF